MVPVVHEVPSDDLNPRRCDAALQQQAAAALLPHDIMACTSRRPTSRASLRRVHVRICCHGAAPLEGLLSSALLPSPLPCSYDAPPAIAILALAREETMMTIIDSIDG